MDELDRCSALAVVIERLEDGDDGGPWCSACGHHADAHELAIDSISYACIIPGCACAQFEMEFEKSVDS